MAYTIIGIVGLINAIAIGSWLVLRFGRSWKFGLASIVAFFVIDTTWGGIPSFSAGLNIYIQDLLFSLFLVAALVRVLENPKSISKLSTLVWILFGSLAFISFARGTAQYGLSAGVSFRSTFYFWCCGLYFMTFQLGPRDLEGWRAYWIYGSLAICVVALIRWISDAIGLSDFTVYGAYVPFRVLNSQAAQFVSIGLIFALTMQDKTSPKFRTVTLLIFAAVVLTLQHRSVWISTVVALGMLLFMSGQIARAALLKYAITALLALILLGAVLQLTGENDLFEALEKSYTTGTNLNVGTTFDRLNTWSILLDRWWSGDFLVKIFGLPFGTGTSRIVDNLITAQKVIKDFSAHNFYVQTLYDLGISGALTCFSVFAAGGIAAWNYRKLVPGQTISLTLLTVMVSNLAYFVAYQGNYLHGALLGLTIASLPVQSRKQSRFHSASAMT